MQAWTLEFSFPAGSGCTSHFVLCMGPVLKPGPHLSLWLTWLDHCLQDMGRWRVQVVVYKWSTSTVSQLCQMVLSWAQSPLGLSHGKNSRMLISFFLLLLAIACVASMGVGLWVFGNHFLTTDIPAAISHPMRLRVLNCILQLLITWVSFVFCLSPPPENNIPGSGRSPGEGNGNLLQCSCLENPMEGGAWQASAVHGVAKSRAWLSNFTFFPEN